MQTEENYAGPRHVLETAKLAEELHQKMYSQQVEEQQEEEELQETPTDEPVENQADQVEQADDPEDDVPDDKEFKDLRKFKDRYLTLKGKYDAEVPRLAAEVKELRKLQDEFVKLKEQASSQTKPVVEEVDPLAKLEEEYGSDLANILREAIDRRVDSKIKPVLETTEERVASVEDTQYKAAQESFKAYLDDKVGGWRDLWEGKDSAFGEFLETTDPTGLYTYGDLANHYVENWDADRLVTLFNLYKQGNTPQPVVQKEPSPQKTSMIAPSRTTSQPTPNIGEKRIWTQADVEDFQRRDRKGQADQTEWNDLLQALAENRIR
jgi:hypothetical protein